MATIGSILIDPDVLTDVSLILPDEKAFSRSLSRLAYKCILALWKEDVAIDMVTLSARMEKAGDTPDESAAKFSFLLDALNSVPTSINVEAYAQIVKDFHVRRQVVMAASRMATIAMVSEMPVSDVVAAARRATAEIDAGESSTVKSSLEFSGAYLDRFQDDVENGVPEDAVVLSGLTDYDNITGGFEKPFMHVIMGRPGHMKSSLALGVALRAARHNQHVLFISLEMSLDQLTGRLVSQISGVPFKSFRRANRPSLLPEEQAKIIRALGELSQLPFHSDQTPALKPSQILARLDRLMASEPVDLLVIDHMHIGLPERSTGNTVIELGEMAMDFANIAKRYGVAALVLAQMNRNIESRAEKRPQMSDINGSGGIEAAASTITGIVVPHKFEPLLHDPHVAMLYVLKNRDGETGQTTVYVDPGTMRLANAARI